MAQARCTLRVRGLDCPNEVVPIRAALEGAPGVLGLGFDLAEGSVTVDFDPDATSPERLVRILADRAKMTAEPIAKHIAPETVRLEGRAAAVVRRWLPTAVAGLGLAFGVVLERLDGPSWILFGIAVAAGALDIVPKAWRSVRQRRLDIHVLMSVALLGALALGQWDEAATIAFLFELSEAVESFTLGRARRAVRRLLEVAPETAEIIEADGTTRVVAAGSLRAGDRVRVRAGVRVPIDGRVVSGRSSVDQKSITGESVPVTRGPGDEVFAGTVNGEGALEVEAARPLDDAVVTRIVERVREAQKGRTPVERTIERFAAVYTPLVVALAALTALVPPLVLLSTGMPAGEVAWRLWASRALVLLVIACPCALIIATPVAIVSALAAAARRGILIKGGQYLEEFARLRTLAFDKTGTLTRGEPDVVEVVPAGGREGDDVLRIAAALGDRGGHVLGRAIARHARDLRLDVPAADDYRAVPGLGATGRVAETDYHIGSHRYIDEVGLCESGFHASLGAAEAGEGTAVALTDPLGPIGWIRLADRPRPEAAVVLAELHAMGLETAMLTGDNAPTARAVAGALGITEQRAGLMPEDKAVAVAELDARRGPTGMVGDGVNDAPALAAARVSVSLGGIGSAAALETADIVLMADDLTGLPWLLRHARRTLSRIHQNIALAVGAKLVVMSLAVVGLAGLWAAVAADVGMSVLVTLNALRLLRSR